MNGQNYHLNASEAVINRYDVPVGSNFNCHFVAFGALKDALKMDLARITQYVKTVEGLVGSENEGTIESGYRGMKIHFDSNEKEIGKNFTVGFYRFLDNDNVDFMRDFISRWQNFKFNYLGSGEKTTKEDYANAQLIVEMFNRNGVCYRIRTAHGIFPSGAMHTDDLGYENNDSFELQQEFRCDWVSETNNNPLDE